DGAGEEAPRVRWPGVHYPIVEEHLPAGSGVCHLDRAVPGPAEEVLACPDGDQRDRESLTVKGLSDDSRAGPERHRHHHPDDRASFQHASPAMPDVNVKVP